LGRTYKPQRLLLPRSNFPKERSTQNIAGNKETKKNIDEI